MYLPWLANLTKKSSNQQSLNQQSLEPQKPKNEEAKNSEIKSLLEFITQKSFSWWLTKGVSLCCAGYLVTILFHGVPQERRLTATDISLFTVLLIFNSDIIERLRTLQINGKDGLAVELQPKLKANTEANTRESEALVFLGEKILKRTEDKKKFWGYLVKQDELEILKTLEQYTTDKNVTLKYNKELTQSLRHLRILKLIEGRTVDSLEDGENLTEIYKLTPSGKICLDLEPTQVNSLSD
jgi:hypothetical protein